MEIAISGMGVAGPTLAHWLLRGGHRPTLIEKAPEFRTGGYIIDFWGLGYTVAERMGLVPEIRKQGYTVKEVRFIDAHGKKVGGFSASVFARMTGGRFTSIARGDLAEIIYRSVSNDAETIFGDSLSSIDDHEGGVSVTFDSGRRRDFDLVIGADGLHSNVRALAFGAENKFERYLGFYVAAFEVPGYRRRDEDVYVSHNTPGRGVARFALRRDRTVFMFVFTAGQMKDLEPQDNEGRRSVLRELFRDMKWETPDILRAMEDADEIYFDRMSQIEMPSWHRGRVMLIGDAAACASLLAGEGTGLAMTEAYILAGELHRAKGDYQAAFRAHEERLRSFVADKQKSARAFAPSFAPETAWGLRLRNLATRLFVYPRAADLLIGRSLKDTLELPDYAY